MTRNPFIALFLLLALAIAPASNLTLLNLMEKTLSRVIIPATDQEKQELQFLSCIEQVGKVMPTRSDVQVVTNDDPYLQQRTRELLYPRHRLVYENPNYRFLVGVSAETESPFYQINCSGINVTVVEVD